MSHSRNETSSVDMLAYQRPSPAKALEILEGYGIEACTARWPFLSAQAIMKIAEMGRAAARAKQGIIIRGPKRTTTPEQEEAAVADVFALGGVSRVADKHGLTYTLVLKLLAERGITDYPKVMGPERARLAAATRLARQAIVAPQATLSPEAVVTAVEEEQVMESITPAPVHEGRARKVPGNETIRADFKRLDGDLKAMATAYGVSVSDIRYHLVRLDLIVPWAPRPAEAPVPVTVPAVQVEAEQSMEVVPAPIPGRYVALRGIDRLDIHDLQRAIELARISGASPEIAVAFVRADRDASALLQSRAA